MRLGTNYNSFSRQMNINIASSKETIKNNNDKNQDNSIFKERKSAVFGKDTYNDMMSNLMEQKDQLIESKNNYMEEAMKNGVDKKIIKERVKTFNENINEINQQISDLKMKAQEEALKKQRKEITEDEVVTRDDDNLKSEEGQEISDSDVTSMYTLAKSLDHTKQLMFIKESRKSHIAVLKSEVKKDISRGLDLNYKNRVITKYKRDINNLEHKIGDKMKKVNENIDVKYRGKDKGTENNETLYEKVSNSVENKVQSEKDNKKRFELKL